MLSTFRWLLWTAVTKEAVPELMRELFLTALRLISPSVFIQKEISRKFTDSWTKGTKQNYQWMFEQWHSFCCERGLPVLEVSVSNLVNYLNFLQITKDYAYRTLFMHPSAICSIFQPTKEMKASTAPLIRQLLKGVFRKNPSAKIWAEVWNLKKIIDLLPT